MLGVFPTRILTLTALYRFSRIRPRSFLLIFPFHQNDPASFMPPTEFFLLHNAFNRNRGTRIVSMLLFPRVATLHYPAYVMSLGTLNRYPCGM